MSTFEWEHMNRLSTQERARILGCLVEGNSIRTTCRMTGATKGTVIKLLADVGAACKAYHDQRDEHAARHFMEDLCKRLATKVQLTTDGLRAYLVAVPEAFGCNLTMGC